MQEDHQLCEQNAIEERARCEATQRLGSRQTDESPDLEDQERWQRAVHLTLSAGQSEAKQQSRIAEHQSHQLVWPTCAEGCRSRRQRLEHGEQFAVSQTGL